MNIVKRESDGATARILLKKIQSNLKTLLTNIIKCDIIKMSKVKSERKTDKVSVLKFEKNFLKKPKKSLDKAPNL